MLGSTGWAPSTVMAPSAAIVTADIAVARDGGGIYAMSAVCTHAGCLVDGSGTIAAGLSCPCHPVGCPHPDAAAPNATRPAEDAATRRRRLGRVARLVGQGRGFRRGSDVRGCLVAEGRRVGSILLLGVVCVACSGAHESKVMDRGAGFVPSQVTPPLIRLARSAAGACPGRCPTYSVEIDADGGVRYTGVINVKTIGPATGHLSPDALQQLRALMARARKAKLPADRCACGCVKDAPIVDLTTWDDGAQRTVKYDEGCERAPHAVRVLEDSVDELVGTERWIGTIQQRRLCFEEERDCTEFGTPERAAPDAGR